ncbi:MAG: hypothetical protein ABIV50_16050 [Opitutus sp.]
MRLWVFLCAFIAVHASEPPRIDLLLAAADDEERESAHVAAIAFAYGIRCIAFRVVSDAPYEGVPFHSMAARATALFSINFIENLPPLASSPSP